MFTIHAHNAAGHVGLAAARGRNRVDGNPMGDAMYPCGWQAGNRVTSTLKSTTFTTRISHKAISPNPVRPKESSP